MNIDTGEIVELPAGTTGSRLVPIDLSLATEKQKTTRFVSLKDHRSLLGQLLTAARDRSKYVPHVGAKQRAKLTNPKCPANTSQSRAESM